MTNDIRHWKFCHQLMSARWLTMSEGMTKTIFKAFFTYLSMSLSSLSPSLYVFLSLPFICNVIIYISFFFTSLSLFSLRKLFLSLSYLHSLSITHSHTISPRYLYLLFTLPFSISLIICFSLTSSFSFISYSLMHIIYFLSYSSLCPSLADTFIVFIYLSLFSFLLM